MAIKKPDKCTSPEGYGATVQPVCDDCVQQNYDHAKDWIYVGYFEHNTLHKGWVDKQYIGEFVNSDIE
jgi:hypothetical protein